MALDNFDHDREEGGMHNQHHQKILALAVPRGCGAVPAAALRTGGPVVLRDDLGIGHILPAGSSLAQHMHDALIDAFHRAKSTGTAVRA